MYEILAKYYDDLMGDFDYDAYEKFALENLKDVWGGFGYDLASGSGEMAIRLKRNGFKVVGGDVSSEMLEKATEKEHELLSVEKDLSKKERKLAELEETLNERIDEQEHRLQEVSGLTAEEAEDTILKGFLA